jgi:hypothetical protein
MSLSGAPRIAGPLAGIGAAVPDFAMAIVFLSVWLAPGALAPKLVSWCLLVMLLEFFVVHSAGFTGFVMTSRQAPHRKLLVMLLLGGFYTLMVGAFSMTFQSWWPLASFWGLMINRMLGGLLARGSDDDRMFVMASWAASVFFYVVLAFVTVIAPIPAFGITPQIVAAQQFTGGGLWIDEPHRVVAFGVFYFLATGLSELFMSRWIAHRGAGRASR